MPVLRECPRLPESLLANARLVPDRQALLQLLPRGGTVVEVGVALGDFSESLIRICEPELFIGIDLFEVHTYPALWGRPTVEIFGSRSHAEFYRDRFAEPIAAGKMRVLEGDSALALERLDEKSVDLFYVDADHSYEAVCRDLAVIKRKVKDTGLIIMNDYTMADVVGSGEPYGVIHATNEFMVAEQWEMTYFALQGWMYCDVVLRKIGKSSQHCRS